MVVTVVCADRSFVEITPCGFLELEQAEIKNTTKINQLQTIIKKTNKLNTDTSDNEVVRIEEIN